MDQTFSLHPDIGAVSTIVVKAGSRIVCTRDNAGLSRINALVEDCAALRALGIRVILVSSGAIANGMRVLNLSRRPSTIPAKQACAAIGQLTLMRTYEELFGAHNIVIGQVLLTWDDLRDKKRYLNLRNTFFHLLEYGSTPIVNENDSVGVEEIRFGDNDSLGAQIALLVGADAYVMLTDTNGLYDANPSEKPDARHIRTIPRITPEIHAMAGHRTNHISVGGMITKLRAAEAVTRSGIRAVIGNGFTGRLRDVLGGERVSTIFCPRDRKLTARRRWIAFAGKSKGTLVIDSGAHCAIIDKGKSLLPAGIRSVVGQFDMGATVDIETEDGRTIARGLTHYSSGDLERIRGCRTADIVHRLGSKPFDEAVHRDNMVVL